jgi:hypothetical protein
MDLYISHVWHIWSMLVQNGWCIGIITLPTCDGWSQLDLVGCGGSVWTRSLTRPSKPYPARVSLNFRRPPRQLTKVMLTSVGPSRSRQKVCYPPSALSSRWKIRFFRRLAKKPTEVKKPMEVAQFTVVYCTSPSAPSATLHWDVVGGGALFFLYVVSSPSPRVENPFLLYADVTSMSSSTSKPEGMPYSSLCAAHMTLNVIH